VPMGWGIGVLSAIAHAVARWPGAVTRLPQMPGAGLACLAVGMAWLGIWRTRLRLLGLAPIVAGLTGTALVTPPDAIVSADAALIAVRSGGRVMVEESVRAGPFDAETPLRLWGEVAVGAQFACAQAACDVVLPGGVIRLIRQGPPVCTGVDLLVSASPLHGACPTTVTVDRQLVARDGAAAIWLTGGRPFVLTDRVWRGVRPWVIGAAERPPLPPALTE